MKKTLTIIMVFGLMFAQAQVGINKDKPDATLDIVAGKTDGSQVEGLLVPRISKEAAYNMAIAATKPQESNMVYVDNANYAFPAGTLDAQKATVADITEKGYYFWNGAKWVSVSTVEGSLWKYANDKVFIDRNNVTDNVEYLKEGGYRHFPRNMRQVTYIDSTGALVDVALDINNASIYNWNLSFSDLIKIKNPNEQWSYKALGQNSFYIDEKETSSILNYYAHRNDVATTKRTTKNFGALYAAINSSYHNGQGNVGRMMGTHSSTAISSPNINVSNAYGAFNQVTLERSATSTTVSGELCGTRNYPSIRGNGTVTSFLGTYNYLQVYPNISVTIEATTMSKNYLHVNENSSGQMGSFYGSYTGVKVDSTSTLKINSMYGSYIGSLNKGQKRNYGIFIESVGNATATENYAIYTKKGKVRLGDDVSIGTTAAPKKLEVSGAIKVGSDSTTPGAPAHAAPKGTIIFHNGSFYGNTDDSSTGWKKLHN